ncbi:hypothetical protein DFP72DRAFT_922837 [Ephemerocybe angulata]|uniref:Uncharacterized protein n=1 Tax=Ephemerocybe angulata TaxID=980116 RepID=A0A8H6LWH1_9AGAR|nr:hypothetical protein DFP72DRAFT_922837 [Tulosesus angulatus]
MGLSHLVLVSSRVSSLFPLSSSLFPLPSSSFLFPLSSILDPQSSLGTRRPTLVATSHSHRYVNRSGPAAPSVPPERDAGYG